MDGFDRVSRAFTAKYTTGKTKVIAAPIRRPIGVFTYDGITVGEGAGAQPASAGGVCRSDLPFTFDMPFRHWLPVWNQHCLAGRAQFVCMISLISRFNILCVVRDFLYLRIKG